MCPKGRITYGMHSVTSNLSTTTWLAGKSWTASLATRSEVVNTFSAIEARRGIVVQIGSLTGWRMRGRIATAHHGRRRRCLRRQAGLGSGGRVDGWRLLMLVLMLMVVMLVLMLPSMFVFMFIFESGSMVAVVMGGVAGVGLGRVWHWRCSSSSWLLAGLGQEQTLVEPHGGGGGGGGERTAPPPPSASDQLVPWASVSCATRWAAIELLRNGGEKGRCAQSPSLLARTSKLAGCIGRAAKIPLRSLPPVGLVRTLLRDWSSGRTCSERDATSYPAIPLSPAASFTFGVLLLLLRLRLLLACREANMTLIDHVSCRTTS